MKRGNDPPRLRELLRDRGDPLALALDEMRNEEPSAEELRRVTRGVRLTLGIPPMGSGGPGGGAGAAGTGAVGGGALKGAGAAPWVSSFFLPMAAGAVSAGAVLFTATKMTPPKSAAAPTTIVAPATPPVARDESIVTVPVPARSPPSLDPEPHARETPPASRVFRPPARSNVPAPAPLPSPPEGIAAVPLAQLQSTELTLVDRAQEELSRDPESALAHAREHEQRFPMGMLAQEREVIAIDALLRLGRRREAESRALRFHAQYPQSAHGRRVDVLLQTAAP
jgi:hypothetical protein